MWLKAGAALATMIGIVTGLGTIVGWLSSSESFGEVANVAVGWAGLAYIGFTAAAVLVTAVLPERRFRSAVDGYSGLSKAPPVVARTVLAVSGAGFVAILVAEGFDPGAFVWFGYLSLALVAMIAVTALAIRASEGRTAHRKCPDCAEMVKTEARVCRYCGFRFAPPPRSLTTVELPPSGSRTHERDNASQIGDVPTAKNGS